ncbi:MAG TPA: ABC transporter permease [Gemmatimonadaceae bacterium]|nr:ABC transporter permease [Gemmatimonadaceae bacterium]
MDDVSQAIRALVRSPVYSVIAILTLALGIGASTAAYTVLNGILLAPLPYAQPDRLVAVLSSSTHDTTTTLMSYPDFEDYDRSQDALTGMAFVTGGSATLHRAEGNVTVWFATVTDNFFSVLRPRPAIGRLLTPEDNRPGAPPVTVLTHDMWVNYFAADPGVIGRDVDVSIGHFTVVGVLGTGAAYPDWIRYNNGSLYVPMNSVPNPNRAALNSRASHSDSRVIARLKPGLTQGQAEQQMRTIARRLAAEYPATDSTLSVRLNPLRVEVQQGVGPALTVLAAAVALVLLLATADVANLGLVRATGRAREIAVRISLGASRGRVIRAMLLDSAVVATAAGILGLGIAILGVKALAASAQTYLPRLDEVHLDLGVLAVALGATALAALLAALAPIAVTRGDLLPALKAGGRGASADRRSVRLRSAIVVAQVALSVVLVSGAGLLIRSYSLLRSVDPGYDPSHLITWGFDTPARLTDPASRLDMMQRIADAMRVPGVQSVVFANHIPLEFGSTATPVGPDNRDYSTDSASAVFEVVSPGYFATMHIPVLRGREFTDADLRASPVPAIVSAATARHYWPNADPIGHEMTVTSAVHYKNPDFGKPIQTTVIGVVGEVKKFSLDEKVQQAVYLPITHPVPAGTWAIARTTVPPKSLVSIVRRRVNALDPYLVTGTEMSDELTRVDGGFAGPQFQISVLGLFSTIALVLAALGLYGVIAYSVTQRTSELGIRMALGARGSDMVSLVARSALVLVVGGLVVGAGGAFVLGRAMQSLLYGVQSGDPVTFVSVAGILMVVGALASYLPARRAARVEPVIALRAE